ncbi:MAG: hypothetical protein ACLGP3_00860 [Acidobacteriota bacterium]
MNSSRIVLNCLAVLVGFFGASLALGSLLIMSFHAFGKLPPGFGEAGRAITIGFLVFTALFGCLGYFFFRQAWQHLRKPDLASAKSVIGNFSVFFALFLLGRFNRMWNQQKSHSAEDSILQLAVVSLILLVVYLFHRVVLKRAIAEAFPKQSATPPSLRTT